MAGARVPLTFRLYKGDSFLREEKLTLPVIKVGKVPSSHLRLDDESVSRMHAVIEVTGPSDVSIIDLGSTRGTFVNGQKVNKAKLQSGDTVLIGDIRIEVSVGGADEEEEIPTRVQVSPQEAVVASSPRPAPAPPAAPSYAGAAANAAAAASPVAAPVSVASSPVSPPSFQPPAYQPPQGQGMMQPPPGIAPPPGMRQFAAGPSVYSASAGPVAFNPMADQVEDVTGARAVEVAAMLGVSVVPVKHCMNPRGGKVTPATYAFFAAGAVSLLISLVAFATAVGNARDNKRAEEYWTRPVTAMKDGKPYPGLGKPHHAFRPTLLGHGYDFASFGGLFFGLGFVTYALARLRNERRSPWFRIGQTQGVEYSSLDAPPGAFPLVAPVGDDFVFNFTRGMEGDMTVEGTSTPLAELAAQGRARPSAVAPDALEVAIPPKARIRVKSGKTTFLVSSVAQPRAHPVPFLAGLEANVLAYFAGSAFVLGGIVWLLGTVPSDQDTGQGDDDSLEQAIASGETDSKEDPPPPEQEEVESDENDESGGTGTAMALDEGKMGKKDSTRAEGQYKMKNNNLDPQLAKAQAIEAAKTAGILGSSALMQGGSFASLTGSGDISSGFDDEDIYGGLLGNEAGEMQGGFGFGRSGFGPGGGGNGWGTVGTGNFGTIGHGNGAGDGYGNGNGRGGMHGRTSSVPQVRIGQPSAVGDLDKAIIRRYIKRNISKITYCYEKQLLAKPGLTGTVSTQFFISPNGTVASANASGVDGAVASCVAGVLKAIEFPKPKGGGGVQVNYPFTFRPTGG
jgi:pSer/pThr/pTyr-binding forkhead associated (FHA) protein